MTGRSNEVWTKNATSWARFPGWLWLAGSRAWPSSVASLPGAPGRPRRAVLGPRRAHRRVLGRLHHAAIPWERVVDRRPRARRRRAAAAGRAPRCGSPAARTPTWARCSCCRCSTWPTSSRRATPGRWRRWRSRPTPRRWSPRRARSTCSSRRTLAYAVAYVGLVATIQFLKRRLVAAERHQHRMARVDPLTGLAEPARLRRGADRRAGRRRALHAAARRRRLLQADQRPLRPHHRRPRPARAGRPHLRGRPRRRLPGPHRRRRDRARRPGRGRRRRPPPRRRPARGRRPTSTRATARSRSPSPSPSTPRTAPTASRSCARSTASCTRKGRPPQPKANLKGPGPFRWAFRDGDGAARARDVGAAVAGEHDHAVVHGAGAAGDAEKR